MALCISYRQNCHALVSVIWIAERTSPNGLLSAALRSDSRDLKHFHRWSRYRRQCGRGNPTTDSRLISKPKHLEFRHNTGYVVLSGPSCASHCLLSARKSSTLNRSGQKQERFQLFSRPRHSVFQFPKKHSVMQTTSSRMR